MMSHVTPTPHPADAAAAAADGVQLRTLVVGDLPLAVVALPTTNAGDTVRARLVAAGVAELAAFLGVRLPQGASVAFVLDTGELRLVDERNQPVIRAPRHGVDTEWIAASRRRRGTMLVVLGPVDLSDAAPPDELCALVENRARSGDVHGAIIGFGDERPSLPLLLR